MAALRALAESVATSGNGKAKKRNPNDPRDAYIYREMKAGTTHAAIRTHVNNHEGWEPLHTEQGISQAAKRYAERHNKPWPLKS